MLAGAGGLALSSVLFRNPPEFVGPVESLIESVTVLVGAVVRTDAAGIGWALGWLMLFLLLVHLAPYLFPTRLSERTAGFPFRLALAGSSTLIGIGLEALVFGTLLGIAPTSVGPWFAGVAAGVTVILFTLASFLPPVGAGVAVFARPDESLVVLTARQRERITVLGFVVRCSLVAGAIGFFLATASMLSPLPEFVVVAAATVDVGRYAIYSHTPPDRLDLEEQFAIGAAVAWAGRRELVLLGYVTAVLATTTALLVYAVSELGDAGAAPLEATALIAIAVATLYAVVYSARMLVRLSAFTYGLGEEVLGAGAIPDRPPGLFVPAGVAIGLALGIEHLPSTPPGWFLVAVAATVAVTLACCVWSAPRPLPVGDFHAIPLGISLGFVAVFLTEAGVEATTTDGTAGDLAGLGVALVVLGICICAPYLLLLPGQLSLAGPFQRVVRTGSWFAVVLAGSLVFLSVFNALDVSDEPNTEAPVLATVADLLGEETAAVLIEGIFMLSGIALLGVLALTGLVFSVALVLAAYRLVAVAICRSRRWLYERSAVSELSEESD